MNSDMNSVERVKAICKERKIPLSRVEKDLGFSNGYIGQLKKGFFPDDRLRKIAKYLDLSVEFLATGKEAKDKENEIVAKNDTEKRLLLLCRRAESASDQDKEMILKNFENTIDMYLQAKGLKAEEQ